jgi:hypothetical protein
MNYETDEFRQEMLKYLKADQSNSIRIQRDKPDFLAWLMASEYPGVTKKEKLYCYLARVHVPPRCRQCSKPVKVKNIFRGYAKACSYICSNGNIEKQWSGKQTLMKNYQVDNPSKSPIIQTRVVDTNQRKYGAKHYMASEQGQAEYTALIRERFGADWFTSTTKFQEVYTENSMRKYGFSRPQQTGRYWDDLNPYQLKPFKLKTGEIVQVHGYDGFLLDFLLSDGLELKDVSYRKSDMPTFLYGPKPHRYFPDAYVPARKAVYEAKSTWTYDADLERNNLKRIAVQEAGLTHWFVIFDQSGNILKMW